MQPNSKRGHEGGFHAGSLCAEVREGALKAPYLRKSSQRTPFMQRFVRVAFMRGASRRTIHTRRRRRAEVVDSELAAGNDSYAEVAQGLLHRAPLVQSTASNPVPISGNRPQVAHRDGCRVNYGYR